MDFVLGIDQGRRTPKSLVDYGADTGRRRASLQQVRRSRAGSSRTRKRCSAMCWTASGMLRGGASSDRRRRHLQSDRNAVIWDVYRPAAASSDRLAAAAVRPMPRPQQAGAEISARTGPDLIPHHATKLPGCASGRKSGQLANGRRSGVRSIAGWSMPCPAAAPMSPSQ
jgi:hypothetical protein